MAKDRIDTTRPVLGYTLRERIGAGGYGEVWSAVAPGGISKAVKFVYGYHDEKRAQAELKALTRVRELRHPFLLSLERIDVVDGQLVVITELADESLKELFDRCVAEGNHGIPRDKLLKYIRETAEALDYLSEEHGLQHLDVKPENLLMVSGHVKVADFGLVKELHDGTQSLMTGLTPIYAPPELFDGRPSRTSDQYSLAIVYQEMLTGSRPFNGVTAAQLASQHMTARPKLSSLPRGDQAVVLRALSKDPDLRFGSCVEMVEALVKRKSHARKQSRRPMAKPAAANTSVVGKDTMNHYLASAEVRQLPPLHIDCSDASVTPTLIIGVGQSGTCVVKEFRQRLLEQVGTDEDYPSISFLCLDTDERDLMAACTSQEGAIRLGDALPIPLRKPEEYRDRMSHNSWLSRRWIYNVPRSLRTEGIRPLGRLAFVDHHEEVFHKLHERVEEVTRAELLARTAETLGLEPVNTRLRVFIVGSIAGGVGSGSMLDLAYMVRTVLLEQGIPDEDVVGFLMHSTGRTATERDLTVANACAFLSEMNHFSGMAGYPGDETCGLPPFEEDSRPFSHAYLVHLGDDLSQHEFEQSISNIAEYVYLNTVSACGKFFDECRSKDANPGDLRTFFVRSAEITDGQFSVTGDDLARLALQRWNTRSEENLGPYRAKASQLLQEGALTIDGVTTMAKTIVEGKLEAKADEFVERAVRQLLKYTAEHGEVANGPQLIENLANTLSKKLQWQPSGHDATMPSEPDWANEAIAGQAHACADPLVRVLTECVDQVGVRFSGALTLQDCLEQQLARSLAHFQDGRQANSTRLAEINQQLLEHAQERVIDASALAELVRKYAQLHLSDLLLSVAASIVKSVKRLLAQHAQDMQPYTNTFLSCAEVLQSEDHSSQFEHLAADLLDELLLQIDRQLQTSLYNYYEGLLAFLAVLNDTRRSELVRLLHNAACRAVRQIRRACDIETALCKNGLVGDAAGDWIEEHLGTAAALMTKCGGASRLMLAVPDRSEPKKLAEWVQQRLAETPTVIPATSGNIVVCHELEQIPLGYMAYRLFCQHPESIEYVSRIHTRIDIDWTPLTSAAVTI